MMVADQVDADFDRARRRAFFGGLKTRFVGGRDRLLSFDEVRRQLGQITEGQITGFTWAGRSSRYLR
jgi:hypothetical protein